MVLTGESTVSSVGKINARRATQIAPAILLEIPASGRLFATRRRRESAEEEQNDGAEDQEVASQHHINHEKSISLARQ